jgi:thioredoxin-like negative regulator of GroEL
MISPLFEKFAASAPADKIAFYKVDVDEQEQISQEVGVKAMPTFVFFKNGQKIHEVVGANPPKLQVSKTAGDEKSRKKHPGVQDSDFYSTTPLSPGCHYPTLCLIVMFDPRGSSL